MPNIPLQDFQPAAFAYCHKINEDPYQQIDIPGGTICRWEWVAAEMAKVKLMIEQMRYSGIAI